MSINLFSVQTYYHQHRSTYPDPFRLRIHRALSWLCKADEQLNGKDASDAKQSAPSKDMPQISSPQGRKLSSNPDWDIGFQSLWIAFNAAYAREIDEQEISGDRSNFRQFLRTVCRLDKEKLIYELVWQTFSDAIRSLAAQDTDTVLLIMFDRLCTLRNQIIHGGATYGSQANRSQLKDACRILTSLLPLILHIMQQHPDYAWGKPYYPFVNGD